MKKILVIGNCTVDLIFQSNVLESKEVKGRWSLAHGGKYLVDHYQLTFGGGGANAAASLASQGIYTWLYAHIGSDHFGEKIIKNLRSFGVKTTLIKKVNMPSAVSAVIIDKTGDRTIFNFRSHTDILIPNHKIFHTMKKADWVALYSLANLAKKEKIKLLLPAKKYGKKIFLSLHGTEYKKGFKYLKDYLKLADLIHLNAYEMADLVEDKVENLNFYSENFAQILGLDLVLVSYDSRGSFAYTKDKIYHQACIKPKKVADTTGAGDGYSAGFLSEYMKTEKISQALYFASLNASGIISQYGAQNGIIKKIR